MRAKRAERFWRLLLLAESGRVPQFDLPVGPGRRLATAVGAEHHRPGGRVVGAGRADERADRPAVVRVPDVYGSVPRPRDQEAAVGAERRGEELQPARGEREDLRPGRRVPDLEREL